MSVRIAFNGTFDPATLTFVEQAGEVSGELTSVLSLEMELVLKSTYGGVATKALKIRVSRDASHAVESDLLASKLLFSAGNAERNSVPAEIWLVDDTAGGAGTVLGFFRIASAQVVYNSTADGAGEPIEMIEINGDEWDYTAVAWQSSPLTNDNTLIPVHAA